MSERSTENRKRQVQGYKSEIKGLQFEQKVLSHFSQKGWRIELRKHIYDVREIDIYGKKEDFLGDKSFLLVECKDKDRVSNVEVMRFMKKVRVFYESLPDEDLLLGEKPPITAVIAYTGVVDKDAEKVAPNFRPKIEFKRF
ncbi:MAG: hypothetical protein KAW47_00240 [Thermoplasmatales archaeon]|nr:hypothetical protein [Thermoplasmatales archaeon]